MLILYRVLSTIKLFSLDLCEVKVKQGKLFGTDGIRGIAEPFSQQFVYRIGNAIGKYLRREYANPCVSIGRDTRASGKPIQDTLVSAILASDVKPSLLGVVPTPGVSYLTRTGNFHMGLVITGSHNSAADNGIKIFNRDGFKLPRTAETEIERLLEEEPNSSTSPMKTSLSQCLDQSKSAREYIDYLIASWKSANRLSSSFKIVLDCSNGATCGIAPEVIGSFGAKLLLSNVDPNGININPHYHPTSDDSHKSSRIKEVVLTEKANIGIFLDGDGDRVLFADEAGSFVDGDHILALLGSDLKKRGALRHNTVVSTIMSNIGLEVALKELGIDMMVTDVGDRHVLEAMSNNEYVLGGEQSGHIILFEDENTTGDGLFIAVRILSMIAEKGKPLSSLIPEYVTYPQIIRNVSHVRYVEEISSIPSIRHQIEESKSRLLEYGPCFVNVRFSGTEEGLVRITIKGLDRQQVDVEATKIRHVIRKELKATNPRSTL